METDLPTFDPLSEDSPLVYDYKCTICGEAKPREQLLTKRVEFSTLGAAFRRVKSRTVAWICGDCRETDPEWNLPPFKAPGQKNRINRVD